MHYDIIEKVLEDFKLKNQELLALDGMTSVYGNDFGTYCYNDDYDY